MKLVEIRPGDVRRLTLPTILLAIVTLAGFLAPGSWKFVAIVAATSALLALSAGLLWTQVGMLSLCQYTFAYLGVWVMAWLNVHARMPFLIMAVLAGLAAVPAGLLVGGLAVRLRGVYLAVTTFTFAVGMAAVLSQFQLPGLVEQIAIRRPVGFQSDRAYFLLCMAVLIVVGLGVGWYDHTRGGRACRAIKYSERATAAAGFSVAAGRLRSFCTSAFVAGLAGALLAGQYEGSVSPSSFAPTFSIALVAVAVMVGAGSLSGGIVAGILMAVVPEVLARLDFNSSWAQILFGVGAIQALAGDSGGIVAGFPWRRAHASTQPMPVAPAVGERVLPPAASLVPGEASTAGAAVPALELRQLTVRYGNVVALNHVDLVVPPATVVGVIGPNGAGKSTLIDAVCGFAPAAGGTILLAGRPIDRLGAARRAKAGLRRTFQQGRAIPDMTVGGFISFRCPTPPTHDELDRILGFFALPPADQPISLVDVGTRRTLEVAATVAAQPVVAFLDEPLAGLGTEQSAELARRIKEVPEQFGCAVVLVEHDLEQVTATCSELTVLDFGQVIAHGSPAEVLRDPLVVAAYIGDAEALHEAEEEAEAATEALIEETVES